jgi:uncharacterized protein YjlB
MDAEQFSFSDDGRIPNSPLPVLLYHDVLEVTDAAACEQLFAAYGWSGAWRDGIFSFHHFHSIAHEVLGVVAGSVAVMLGGPDGQRFDVRPGDVLVLPAGVGHCNCGADSELLVVGAYPGGMQWDVRRGDPSEHDKVRANIAAVPLPERDPVRGGPIWVG